MKLELRTAQGIIETSLWNSMDDNELDPMLALDFPIFLHGLSIFLPFKKAIGLG